MLENFPIGRDSGVKYNSLRNLTVNKFVLDLLCYCSGLFSLYLMSFYEKRGVGQLSKPRLIEIRCQNGEVRGGEAGEGQGPIYSLPPLRPPSVKFR